MPTTTNGFRGAGLGLRRALLGPLLDLPAGEVDFLEVAPENWLNLGGRLGKQFQQLAERYPIAFHGLSLDIGGPDPLDTELVQNVADFMRRIDCPVYSEHLTYCAAEGHLYDLLPIPFTEEAVHYVASRVRQVQDITGQRLALENASYYAQPNPEMTEAEFIGAVLSEADCDLLLDVNNIYVNSINHHYDPLEFLAQLPLARARYIHVAGHFDEADDLKVDTHGADVIDPVWQLLSQAYECVGTLPTLLERDFNIPPLPELMQELGQVKQRQALAQEAALSHA